MMLTEGDGRWTVPFAKRVQVDLARQGKIDQALDIVRALILVPSCCHVGVSGRLYPRRLVERVR
jgi:hypothetical protein